MEKTEQQTVQQEFEKVTKKGVEYFAVQIPRTNKKYLVRTLTPNQMEDLAKLLIPSKENVADAVIEDTKIAAKAAAIYLRPGYWKRKLSYWFLWRWFYYIKQYDCAQLQPILSAGQNSIPYIDFLKTMSILVNQKTTQMRMTRAEAEKVMQELSAMADKRQNGNGDGETKDSQ